MVRGGSSWQTFSELRQSRNVMQQTVQSLEQQNRVLELEISKIKQSPDYAKKVLRDKYHITDVGENIVFFGDQ